MKAISHLQRLFGFGAAKPKAADPAPEAINREATKKAPARAQKAPKKTPQSPTARAPIEGRKQKSDESRAGTKLNAPLPGGPTAAPGVRWPGERQPGTRKKGTPDDGRGP
jgi:hypothetical protein